MIDAQEYHDEHYWYSMIELGVSYKFMKRGFDPYLDSYEIDGEWHIRCGFEWESIGHFAKEWR